MWIIWITRGFQHPIYHPSPALTFWRSLTGRSLLTCLLLTYFLLLLSGRYAIGIITTVALVDTRALISGGDVWFEINDEWSWSAWDRVFNFNALLYLVIHEAVYHAPVSLSVWLTLATLLHAAPLYLKIHNSLSLPNKMRLILKSKAVRQISIATPLANNCDLNKVKRSSHDHTLRLTQRKQYSIFVSSHQNSKSLIQ